MCGCRKNSSRRPSRANTARITAQSNNIASNNTPAQIRALGIQNNTQTQNKNQLDADRRRIEKVRRDAIKKAFGR